MDIYWGPAVAAVAAIIGAWLSRLQNRDSKQIDHDLGVAQLQRDTWKDLLAEKDHTIVDLRLEVEKLRGRLAELDEPDKAITERDAIIAALVAKLGPVLSPPDEGTSSS